MAIGTALFELHLGYADFFAPLVERFDLLLDGLVCDLETADDFVFVDLVGARFHHGDGVGGAGDDQIDVALLDLGVGGIDYPTTVDPADTNAAHRSHEGSFGQGEGRGGAHQSQHVVGIFHVDRDDGRHEMDFLVEAFRPERADRPIHYPRGDNGVLTGPPFALDESAGELPGRVHPLFYVYRQREEIDVPAGRGHHGRNQNDRISRPDYYRSTRLLRQLACLELELALADRDFLAAHLAARTLNHSLPFLSRLSESLSEPLEHCSARPVGPLLYSRHQGG